MLATTIFEKDGSQSFLSADSSSHRKRRRRYDTVLLQSSYHAKIVVRTRPDRMLNTQGVHNPRPRAIQ